MTAVDRLGRAVRDWLATLDQHQRRRASFAFGDGERFVWAYTPGERAGLALGDMETDQRAAAMRVVDAALSERGAHEVAEITALEAILGAIERDAGRSDWGRRDPDRYWFAVFGEPATDPAMRDAPWSWRIGGHHVAIHITVADRRVVGSTPSFLGANPAVVPSGPTAGTRVLSGEEALAREILTGLTPQAHSLAVVDALAPPDIMSGHGARADLRTIPQGIRYDRLGPDGRDGLARLIRHYLGRATDEVAAADWARVADAGLDSITFAWAGPTEPGRGHYYAVRGPTFLVEYDNTQDGANHIHAVWRDLKTDWGGDVLAAHYESGHRTPA